MKLFKLINTHQKNFLLVFGFLTLTVPKAHSADVYTISPPSSAVSFKIRHLGVSFVRGQFEKFKGKLIWEGDKLVQFDGTVEMNSLNTGIKRRDTDLKSNSFFAVSKFPLMVIKSEHIFQANDVVLIKSALTIRDITRIVELHGKINHYDAQAKTVDLFLQGNIDRKDFGLRLNKLFEFFVGETVNISLKLYTG